MMYDNELESAYLNYFKTKVNEETSDKYSEALEEKVEQQDTDVERYTAENNISDIDQLGEILRKLLNAAWGSEWGEFSTEYPVGEDPTNIKLPMITYDTVSREVTENTKIKPTLIDTIYEVVDGKATGDILEVYSQLFDCIVEFNVWGNNNLEARTVLNKFEKILTFYSGYLKQNGVSEIFFLKEIPAKSSIHYIEDTYMKPIIFYIRLERKTIIRQSTIKEIELTLRQEPKTTEVSSDDIYNNNNIKYDFES